MAVKSTKEYIGVPRDLEENYGGKRLVFFCWINHMLFAAPINTCVEPDMNFGDYIENVVMPFIQADPDAASIEWDKVEWTMRGESWTPDFDKSISENGIEHKDMLKFTTPGLSSLVPLS